MKKIRFIEVRVFIITIVIMLITQFFKDLPWWSFVIPVIGFGLWIRMKKWNVKAFPIGFIAGFLVWFGGNLYFHLTYNGIVLKKIGLLLGGNTAIVMLLAGIIGGIITGLALFIGRNILLHEDYHTNTINE